MTPGTEQRKLAAIMFTDMVGYSALSQRKESLALELLEEHRHLVRGILPKHNGREVKTTGDGFLLEFPSALAAVQAAVAIQTALHERNQISPPERQLKIRIGIHVGDVVVSEGDIHGDGVNIAARLEPLAEAGGICVSNAVFEQVRNKLEQSFVSLGPAELKNIELPVAVHRVVLPWEKREEESRKQKGDPSSVAGRRRVESRNVGRRSRWGIALVGLAVLLGVGVGWWQVLSRRTALEATKTVPRPGGASPPAPDANRAPGTLSRQRLVLLPFKSLASGEANEIFTDGLAVELFSKLSHIRGLQVIDGSGFVKSQGEAKDFSAKWRELNAGALLKGTVLKEQKQLRIRLQLLDSQTQELLKAFDFDREPESVLALQTEAAEAIASTLEVQLLADERRQLSRRPTENPRAYQFYLEGRAFWSRYTEAGWRRSIELFNDAIGLDPNFAPAYAGLADSYAQLGMDFLPPGEGFAVVKTNALRAAQLQPDLAPAYVSLAQCRMWFDRDYPAAKQAFETALRLQPRYPDTYHFFAHYYETLGQMPRAIELLQQGIALDPLSSVLQTELGWAYFHARRYAEGAAECRKVLASDPTFDYARYVLALNLVQLGQHNEAIRGFEQSRKPLGWASVLGDLGYAYALAGKTQQARDVLRQLLALKATTPWQAPSAFGFVHLGLGETNQALAEFERAVEAHDVYMAWMKVEPRFDPLRLEPRFQAMLSKMNLVK